MSCARKYSPNPRRRDIPEAVRKQALHMTVEGAEVCPIPQQSQTAFKEITLWSNGPGVPFVKNEAAQSSSHADVGIKIQSAQKLAVELLEKQIRPIPCRLQQTLRGVTLWLNKVVVPSVKSKAIRQYDREAAATNSQPPQELSVRLGVPESRPIVAPAAELTSTRQKWGFLPEIALLQAVSLLLLAVTFVTARAGSLWSQAFFWVGLAVLIVPVAVRQYSTETSRQERIALILLLGGALYLTKFMHSPFAFTYPDEFSTFRNVREILENQRLFVENPELPAAALYPALATVTSLLVSLSGLSIYPAGLLVTGAARLVLFLALFLLYERVSGSARIGGLGTLFYMANSNFLFYTAEFSYESLALPIAIFVLYVVARRETTDHRRFALTIVALLGVFMVVISHHMTSYILTGLLFAATGISILRTRGRVRGPWDLALVAALAVSFWLIYVATYTIQYLSPVLWKAIHSVLRLIMQEETSRQPFKSSSTTYVSPLWEQLTVYSSLLIIALGLPAGWLNLWQRHRNRIISLLLGAVALGFLPMQAMRLTSAGWETANRSSEFLFIGVAYVLALAIDQLWHPSRDLRSFLEKIVVKGLGSFRTGIAGGDRAAHLQKLIPRLSDGWSKREFRWIYVAVVVVLIFGGINAGWPPQARMSRPYLVDTGSHIVQPQYVQVAKWIFDHLGPDHPIVTSKVGSKLFSAYAEQTPFTGGKYGIKDLLFSKYFGRNELEIMRNLGIEYIVYDRRRVSWDLMIGFYFLNSKSSPSYEFLEFETYDKFDRLQGVNRILDSGNTVIYDVRIYLKSPLEANETIPSTTTAGVEPNPVSP